MHCLFSSLTKTTPEGTNDLAMIVFGKRLRVLDKPAIGKLLNVRDETSNIRHRRDDGIVRKYNVFLLGHDLSHCMLDPTTFIFRPPVHGVHVPKDQAVAEFLRDLFH